MNKIKENLISIFKFDLRSLALTRIGISTLVLIDLIIRATELEAHYTDFGILPRIALLELSWDNWFFSFHLINGSFLFQLFLFIVSAIFAISLLVGFKTRISTIICWILLLSLHARNPMILQGGDVLLRLLLFWGIFIPWGERFSIDSLKKSDLKNKQNEMFSLGAFAFVVQISLMYLFTGLLKTGDEWQKDYTAIYYSLSLEQMRLWLGSIVYKYPEFMKTLTFTTIWLELLGPLFFFIPIKRDFFRAIGILTFASFQFGIFLALRVGLFPIVSICSLFIMVPGKFWEYSNHLIPEKWIFQIKNFIRSKIPHKYMDYDYKTRKRKNPVFINIIIAVLLTYIIFWNLTTINIPSIKMFEKLEWPAVMLRIDQKWEMFAPFPFKDDGWYVIPGELRNGEEIDVFREGEKLSWEKPENQIKDYKIYRWRKYMRTIWLKTNVDHRLHYGRYLCRKWNRENSYENQLMGFNIYYMKEETLPDYKTAEIEKVHLWEHKCF